jgi:4-hydroxy-2-oxoglutarate aldolase
MKLHGIIPALTTSFNEDGELDRAKTFFNIQKLNQIALSGYLVCGSTGETPLLSTDERVQSMEWIAEASAPGKVLIAGVGAESVSETVRMADRAANAGYHFVLVLTPFYFKNQMHRPDTQALFFRCVADRSKVPVLLYNLPQVTGYHLPPDTIAELSHHPNIVGMKDSSGNLEKLKPTLAGVKPGFQTLSGSAENFGHALQMGAAGAILAIANAIPYTCVTVWEAFRTREEEAALDWQARMIPGAKLLASRYGIPGLKYAMELNGYYGGPPRLPLTRPCAQAKAEIEQAFSGLRG